MRLASFLCALTLVLLPACSNSYDVPAAPEKPSSEATALREKAQAKAAVGDYSAALELFEKARRATPGSLAILYDLAIAAQKAGKPVEGLKAITAMEKLDPKLSTDSDVQGLKNMFKQVQADHNSSVTASPQERLELDTLRDITREARAATQLEEQRKLLEEILAKSAKLAHSGTNLREVWELRARAALGLSQIKPGWEAGRKLVALNALNSEDPELRQLMAQLNRRGWLEEMSPFPRASNVWVNTLGMKFVPVPGADVLFCIWETRNSDYRFYVAAKTGADDSRNASFVDELAALSQTPSNPVVHVSRWHAHDFCSWLTKKEQKLGILMPGQHYRLPTDLEWSAAVGLLDEEGKTPEERDGKLKGRFPWGTRWPPPALVGNFSNEPYPKVLPPISPGRWADGYADPFKTIAPVGSFPPNSYGIFDLEGNVEEWCEDSYDGNSAQGEDADRSYVVRGGGWRTALLEALLSSRRRALKSGNAFSDLGFRAVLTVGETSR